MPDTIWRPPIVCGFAANSPLNVMACIGAHVCLMKELGRPACYPGGPSVWGEVADSRLIAAAFEHAAQRWSALSLSLSLSLSLKTASERHF
eukprot:COSAG04_NODE_11615_length_698_cov_1.799666_3_plen_91_part_00